MLNYYYKEKLLRQGSNNGYALEELREAVEAWSEQCNEKQKGVNLAVQLRKCMNKTTLSVSPN